MPSVPVTFLKSNFEKRKIVEKKSEFLRKVIFRIFYPPGNSRVPSKKSAHSVQSFGQPELTYIYMS